MNFTDSPFERMMKEPPRPGNDGGHPCDGCHISNYCKSQPGRCQKCFRPLIVKPAQTSGQVGPKYS